MKLRAKIRPDYLDQILSGDKRVEYRQLEEIELDDGQRVVRFTVDSVNRLSRFWDMRVRENHPDVPWLEMPIHEIRLGVMLERRNKTENG
jgi:hypothetical protein